MKVYYHDNQDTEDKQLPHDTGKEVSIQDLENLGILAFHFDSVSQVDEIATTRGYVSRDEVNISPASFAQKGLDGAAFFSKLDEFYAEHLHEDEEIRYILDGAGYFDVRDADDNNTNSNSKKGRWIRAYLEKGDLLILPAGIYHRFTVTTDNYVKAMRLFKEEPKWIAHNRPEADNNPYRKEYLNQLTQLQQQHQQLQQQEAN